MLKMSLLASYSALIPSPLLFLTIFKIAILFFFFGKHIDKTGSYSVQDKKDFFVEKIFGDFFTVVGLPDLCLSHDNPYVFCLALKNS
jgi:hypothetical protein